MQRYTATCLVYGSFFLFEINEEFVELQPKQIWYAQGLFCLFSM